MRYTTKEITELMEKSAQLGVSVEIIDRDFTVRINKKQDDSCNAMPQTEKNEKHTASRQDEAECSTAVKSPIVGTFYASPSPEKAPFVEVGQHIKKGDVLFVIESMKLMNEVQSEYDGTVKKILVQSGQPVEYGQAVILIDN
ncbi:MAG: biotin/lipoyl-containing protein [Hydrogenoanaerobacterium sp.]